MIHLSQAAIAEVNRIKSKTSGQAPSQGSRFRLGIQKGGCADFCYTLGLDETITAADQIFNCDGIQVIVDTHSWNYLNGLTLDYSEDLMGGGFRFHNPNAANTCGCGNSFSVKLESAED